MNTDDVIKEVVGGAVAIGTLKVMGNVLKSNKPPRRTWEPINAPRIGYRAYYNDNLELVTDSDTYRNTIRAIKGLSRNRKLRKGVQITITRVTRNGEETAFAVVNIKNGALNIYRRNQ